MLSFPKTNVIVPNAITDEVMSIDDAILILAHLRRRNVLNRAEHYAVTMGARILECVKENQCIEFDSIFIDDEIDKEQLE